MQIPTPPSDFEKYLYVDQNKFVLYLLGVFSSSLLIAGNFLFIYKHPTLYPYAIFVSVFSIYLILSYYVGVFGKKFDLKKHRKITSYPSYNKTIDVYLPSCGEPIEIIRNTFQHVKNLNWPQDRLRVYVLDDSGNPNVMDLAHNYGFYYVSRENRGELKKAGNIRNAFKITRGDFILILDADFCPRPDMLQEMMPYFDNEEIAIVQSPQFFEIKPEDPWVQKGAAYVQELFYRLIQVSRNTWNASVCVGTCAVYRRKALEPHGGTAAIAYSEDLHTGFQAISDGWKIEYIPLNLSKGICPDNASAFITQQYRWCTGSFSLFINPKFWINKIGLQTRLAYLSGMLYYVATATGLFMIPVPGIIMVWAFPEAVFWYNVLFSIPSFLYGSFAIALWSKNKWGLYLIYIRQVSYWAHAFAIYDKLKNKTIPWVSTGDVNIKKRTSSTYARFKNHIMNWNLIVFCLTFSGIFYRMADFPYYHFLPNLFFCILNFYIPLVILKNLDND